MSDISDMAARNRREIEAQKALQRQMTKNIYKKHYETTMQVTIPQYSSGIEKVVFFGVPVLLVNPIANLFLSCSNNDISFTVRTMNMQAAFQVGWIVEVKNRNSLAGSTSVTVNLQIVSNVDGEVDIY